MAQGSSRPAPTVSVPPMMDQPLAGLKVVELAPTSPEALSAKESIEVLEKFIGQAAGEDHSGHSH